MVANHSTRTRARASKPAAGSTDAPSPVATRWAQELGDMKSRLEIISATVAVAVNALEGQNAEIDLDVANTLRNSVRNALADQVDRLSELIEKADPPYVLRPRQ